MAGRKVFFASLVLVVLTCLAYGRVLTGGAGYVWDDDAHVKVKAALRDGQGLIDMWAWGPRAVFRKDQPAATPQYYPVTFTSFWVEYQMWGLWATGYHATNVGLHLLSAFLIWIILRKLGVGGTNGWVAWFAAALFAVHPVNVESVAWISERKNTLSLALYLLAALCWIVWDGLDVPVGLERKRFGQWLFWAIFLFALALLAKSVTVTLPAALLLVVWWKRGRAGAKEWKGLLPLFGIGVLSGALTAFIETNAKYIGATGKYFPNGFGERCLIAGRAIWFYLESLVAPIRLIFFYPRWQLDPQVMIEWAAPIAVLVGTGGLVAAAEDDRAQTDGDYFIVSLGLAADSSIFIRCSFSLVAGPLSIYWRWIDCVGAAVGLGLIVRRMGVTARGGIMLGMVVLLTNNACCRLRGQGFIRDEKSALYQETLAVNPGAWVASPVAGIARGADGPKAFDGEKLYRNAGEHPGDGRMFNGMGRRCWCYQGTRRESVEEQAVEAMPEDVQAYAGLEKLAAAG